MLPRLKRRWVKRPMPHVEAVGRKWRPTAHAHRAVWIACAWRRWIRTCAALNSLRRCA